MKVLVIRLSSLGDVILSSAVLNPLYEKGFEIDFLTFEPFDQLFTADYRIKKIIPVKREDIKGIKEIFQFAKRMEDYDYIIDLHSNFRSILISKLTGGIVLKYRKKGIKRRLYTKPFLRKFSGKPFNVVEGYIETLKPLGIKKNNIRPELILSEKEIEKVKRFIPEKFVAVGAGARYKNKAYPYFDKVSHILRKKGIHVVLVGSQSDRDIDRGRYPEDVIDLRGKLSLRESLSVLSCAQLTISNDSAVAHMSRAVNTPVLMIYGATHPFFGFYPFPDEGDYILKGIKCQPCHIHGKKKCRFKTVKCLEIPPEFVVDKALKLVKNSL